MTSGIYKRTEKHREANSQAKMRHIVSPEARAKIGETQKGRPKSAETKKRMSASRKGELNSSWKGGISSLNNRIRNSREYRLWRKAVFERDGHKCIWCGSVKNIEADHINRFSIFPELRFVVENGRTLCKLCHLTLRKL